MILSKARKLIKTRNFVNIFGIPGLFILGDRESIAELCKNTDYLYYKKRSAIVFQIGLTCLEYYQNYDRILHTLQKCSPYQKPNDRQLRFLIVALLALNRTPLDNDLPHPKIAQYSDFLNSLFFRSGAKHLMTNSNLFNYADYLFFRNLVIDLAKNGLWQYSDVLAKSITEWLTVPEREGKLSRMPIFDGRFAVSSVGHFVMIYFNLLNRYLVNKELKIGIKGCTDNLVSNSAIKSILEPNVDFSYGVKGAEVNSDFFFLSGHPDNLTIYEYMDSCFEHTIPLETIVDRDMFSGYEQEDEEFRQLLVSKSGREASTFWFVTLHVRENGFRFDPLGLSGATRDASISDYYDLVRVIYNHGGLVVRCGDASMSAVSIDGLFDYALSPWKSEKRDLYLMRNTFLHIGTNSGLSYVPLLFAKPIFFTNDFPLLAHISNRNCISLPKKVFNKNENRFLSLDELADPEIVDSYGDGRLLVAKDMQVLHNKPGLMVRCLERILDARECVDGRLTLPPLSKLGRLMTIKSRARKALKISVATEYFEE